jgi:hypothetical protein
MYNCSSISPVPHCPLSLLSPTLLPLPALGLFLLLFPLPPFLIRLPARAHPLQTSLLSSSASVDEVGVALIVVGSPILRDRVVRLVQATEVLYFFLSFFVCHLYLTLGGRGKEPPEQYLNAEKACHLRIIEL